MEKTERHTEYIAHLLETLSEEDMSVLDFDRLKVWLGEISEELRSYQDLEGQLQLLRTDYAQRIAGMVKAMAAVERKSDSWEEALSFVNSLPSLETADLVACYRRVSARFRHSFPASFGLLRESPRGLPAAKDVNDYK